MSVLSRSAGERPREWRRRVLIPAKLRSSAGWGDARILNVSSRGMMIHCPHDAEPGSMIELRRGEQTIIARVMWKRGAKAGLMSETVLPLIDILSMDEAPDGALVADRAAIPKEAANKRDAGYYRRRARLFELAAIGMAAAVAAIGIGWTVGGFLGAELELVRAALTA